MLPDYPNLRRDILKLLRARVEIEARGLWFSWLVEISCARRRTNGISH